MSKDPYWDELGVAWIADAARFDAAAPALEDRLRRQTRLIAAGLWLSFALAIAGTLVGVATVWLGATSGAWNFVIRGVAIVLVSLLALLAGTALLPVRAGDNARAVSEMIELSLARAKRWLHLVHLALAACAIAAVFGLAGTAVRAQLSGPPKLSPVVDLAVLGLAGIVLALFRQRTRITLAKLEYLQRAMAAEA